MATVKRHYNPETGKVSACHAQHNCPLSNKYGEEVTAHAVMSDAEARDFEEKMAAKTYGGNSLGGVSKKRGRPVSEEAQQIKDAFSSMQQSVVSADDGIDYSGNGSVKYLDILNGSQDPNDVGFGKAANAFVFAAAKNLDSFEKDNSGSSDAEDLRNRMLEAQNLIKNSRTNAEKKETLDKINGILNDAKKLNSNKKEIQKDVDKQLVSKETKPRVKPAQPSKPRRKSAAVQEYEDLAVKTFSNVGQMKNSLPGLSYSNDNLNKVANYNEEEFKKYVETTPWKQVKNDLTKMESESYQYAVKNNLIDPRDGDAKLALSRLESIKKEQAIISSDAEHKKSLLNNSHKDFNSLMSRSIAKQGKVLKQKAKVKETRDDPIGSFNKYLSKSDNTKLSQSDLNTKIENIISAQSSQDSFGYKSYKNDDGDVFQLSSFNKGEGNTDVSFTFNGMNYQAVRDNESKNWSVKSVLMDY